MYCLNRTKLMPLGAMIIIFVCGCRTSKFDKQIYQENIIGEFAARDNKIQLKINSDSTFLLNNDRVREYSIGHWSINNENIYLKCEKPKSLIAYLTSYKLIIDTTYVIKANKKGIVYDHVLLNKR
ncbi:hypothetical protein D3C87_1642260 [compost metagenome]